LPDGLQHDAFLYRGVEEYARTVRSFVRDAAPAPSPALIAVPERRARLLRALLDDGPQEITFVDMTELGRNPARIIPALRRFAYAHPQTSTRVVVEALWPDRNPAECTEAMLHESLIPAALAGSEISILCPHDAGALDPGLLDAARRTHSHVVEAGTRQRSPAFATDQAARISRQPLPPPPDDCRTLVFHDGGLAGVRRFVEEEATQAGFAFPVLEDLLLAVNELATNTLVHAGPTGILRVWCDAATGDLVCDVRDDGHITDPLAGRAGPYPVAERGWGLWMVNQVCDLVEMRSGDWGTNIRLHMRLAGS
jgi:anti-sigma regulatory factor (Ser/Thr protein kinase)